MYKQTTDRLIKFIADCPSSYHTIQTISNQLTASGFTELSESENWTLSAGNKYFVTRNLSSVIAFKIPEELPSGFMLSASHSESPCFKIKPGFTLGGGSYVRLNTERYGGMIYSSWLDRPLSVAGRITVDTDSGIKTQLINIDRDLVVIPNVAIHLSGKPGGGYELKPAKDLFPLYGSGSTKTDLADVISAEAGIRKDRILGTDLFLYNRNHGSTWGSENEFFSAPRIDDLQCAFCTLEAFIESVSDNLSTVSVYCVFDNEEVGSGTKQGARSTFLSDVLHRIAFSLGLDESEYIKLISSSMMLSADNGHAVHPNSPELSDPMIQPVINGGVIIKYNANQKYTTDAVSDGIFRKICKNADIPVQEYANRSDLPGGSTLGNLSAEKVSVNTVDIGLAQLAMHSAYETAGVLDTEYLKQAVKAFYSAEIYAKNSGEYIINL